MCADHADDDAGDVRWCMIMYDGACLCTMKYAGGDDWDDNAAGESG